MDDKPLAKSRLGYLDVARAVAASLVLLQHGLDVAMPGFLSSTLGVGNLGRAGVILFLLISGFIIPASLEQGGSNARFWQRRFFRLYPAYWFSIFLAYVLTRNGLYHLEVSLEKPGVWLVNLTMLQGFLNRPNVLGVFWTLHLELVIYIACSILFSFRLLQYARGSSPWLYSPILPWV